MNDDKPIQKYLNLQKVQYEWRVVRVIKSKEKDRTSSVFGSVWYMRDRNGFSSWWKQEQNDNVVTQFNKGLDLLQIIQDDKINYYFQMNVT